MGLVGSVAAFVASRPLTDNSFLTHLATGRLILERGVPESNPFLFTGTDFPVPSWWWSVLLGVTEVVAGPTGIRVVTAVVAFAVGAVLVRLARVDLDLSGSATVAAAGGVPVADDRAAGRSGDLLATVLPAGLGLYCVLQFLSGRPHLAGYLLLALALVVATERRSPWWLVGIFTIWVNVHGSWLYGVMVLGLLVAARWIDERRVRTDELMKPVAAALGVVLGGVLYPRAFELVLLPTRQFGDPIEREALSAYREWARVGLGQPMLWALLVLGGLAAWGALRRRRWGTLGMVVLLVVMGWSGARLVPIAAVSLVPFAGAGLAGLGSLGLPTGVGIRRCWTVSAAVLALTVVGVVATPDYRLDRYPVAAVDWLVARDLAGASAPDELRVVSHDYVGNYLEWRFGADANAYVDDRPDAATLVQYRRILRVEEGWQQELVSIDPDVVLWRTESPLTAELATLDGWVRAVELGDYTVFCHIDVAARCA